MMVNAGMDLADFFVLDLANQDGWCAAKRPLAEAGCCDSVAPS
jgi:hypothetical protein